MPTDAPAPRLLPIDRLNALPRAQFAPALQPLFEAARPLADALYAERPFASYDDLLARAAQAIERLPEAAQVEVVNAHPRIGAPAATLRESAPLSYREQGYDREAALDAATLEPVLRELAELNRVYEARFGFRFVVFVNRRPKSEILEVLRQRLDNPREQELATALHDLLAIARDRLRTLTAGG